MRFEMAFFLHK